VTVPATPLAPPPRGWWWAVAAGGAVGTALRALWLWHAPTVPGLWPTTIFLENLLGAFALGVLVGVLARRRAPGWLRSPFFSTGLLGSFTTFSSLAWDVAATAPSEPVLAVAYGAVSLALGLTAAAAGWRLGRGNGTGRT
jgi:fluoride exporter